MNYDLYNLTYQKLCPFYVKSRLLLLRLLQPTVSYQQWTISNIWALLSRRYYSKVIKGRTKNRKQISILDKSDQLFTNKNITSTGTYLATLTKWWISIVYLTLILIEINDVISDFHINFAWKLCCFQLAFLNHEIK